LLSGAANVRESFYMNLNILKEYTCQKSEGNTGYYLAIIKDLMSEVLKIE
jgi:hypothetical protein